MADMNKATYIEELEVVWRPGRNSPSLSSDAWTGSTLTPVCEDFRPKGAIRDAAFRKRDRDRRTYAAAKRDFAWYAGR